MFGLLQVQSFAFYRAGELFNWRVELFHEADFYVTARDSDEKLLTKNMEEDFDKSLKRRIERSEKRAQTAYRKKRGKAIQNHVKRRKHIR
jgi:hypothetical protein